MDEEDNSDICIKEFIKAYLMVLDHFNLPKPSEESFQQMFNEYDGDKSC